MERFEIERAVKLAGLELPNDVDYHVVGQDPILPSPHYLGNGSAVVRLLTGLAANELWRLRTGRSQEVVVDARHAAESLRSYRITRTVGQEPPELGSANLQRQTALITRIVAAQNGRYVQLHGSFHDGPQILEELGLDGGASSDQIDAAVAGRDAFELEAAFIRRRVCGGVVRSKAEWAEHPQGRAIADLPAVTITRIGDAPPEPLPEGERPTAGVRVIDLTRVLAGPTCARTLAEHGADVLHITAPHLEGADLFGLDTGIGKRQAELDLNAPEQAVTMRDLIVGADIFSQGYRFGTLARRGFAPDQVAALRPGIVYVSENCYGQLRTLVREAWLGATGPGRHRHDVQGRGGRAGWRAAPGSGRGQRLQHRLPRRLWRHGRPGQTSHRRRVVARAGVAQPELHVVPTPRRRQRHGRRRRRRRRVFRGRDGYR